MSKINYAFVGFVVIVVIIFLGFKSDVFKGFKNPTESEISKQANLTGFVFEGRVVSIEGNTIKLNGSFLSSSTPADLRGARDFSFSVSFATNFRKLQRQMPSYESLKSTGKTSGTYNIRDLPTIEMTGSLTDLKDSVSKGGLIVKASFVNTSFDTKNPIPTEVFYQLLLAPSPEKI